YQGISGQEAPAQRWLRFHRRAATILHTRSPHSLPYQLRLSVENPSTNRKRELAFEELPRPPIVKLAGGPMLTRTFRAMVVAIVAAAAVPACAPDDGAEPVAGARRGLASAPLIITEVAQSTAYGGTTADKVEVYCTIASGCAAFKVCDTAASGGSCSATQPSLGALQRAVISRGTGITTSDQVWLADGAGAELPDTRVGTFNCGSGQSQTRPDCGAAPFGACAAPDLGASSGTCIGGEFPEPFNYTVAFTTNQHGTPESTCNRPVCQQLLGA